MSREPEENGPAADSGAANTAGAKAAAPKPRAGVPVWRTGKPDAVLAAAVDAARTAVEGIAPAEQIGRHLGARSEGDRLVTHLFESKLAGYGGWQWFAVLTRNSRSKVVTVDEIGLLPSEDSILAPEWVPWAERVRPEDARDEEAADPAATAAAAVPAAGTADREPADETDGESDDEPADETDDEPDDEQPAREAD